MAPSCSSSMLTAYFLFRHGWPHERLLGYSRANRRRDSLFGTRGWPPATPPAPRPPPPRPPPSSLRTTPRPPPPHPPRWTRRLRRRPPPPGARASPTLPPVADAAANAAAATAAADAATAAAAAATAAADAAARTTPMPPRSLPSPPPRRMTTTRRARGRREAFVASTGSEPDRSAGAAAGAQGEPFRSLEAMLNIGAKGGALRHYGARPRAGVKNYGEVIGSNWRRRHKLGRLRAGVARRAAPFGEPRSRAACWASSSSREATKLAVSVERDGEPISPISRERVASDVREFMRVYQREHPGTSRADQLSRLLDEELDDAAPLDVAAFDGGQESERDGSWWFCSNAGLNHSYAVRPGGAFRLNEGARIRWPRGGDERAAGRTAPRHHREGRRVGAGRAPAAPATPRSSRHAFCGLRCVPPPMVHLDDGIVTEMRSARRCRRRGRHRLHERDAVRRLDVLRGVLAGGEEDGGRCSTCALKPPLVPAIADPTTLPC